MRGLGMCVYKDSHKPINGLRPLFDHLALVTEVKLKWWRQCLLILEPSNPCSTFFLSFYLSWQSAVTWQPLIVHMPSCAALIPGTSSSSSCCCFRELTDDRYHLCSLPLTLSVAIWMSPLKVEPHVRFPFWGEINSALDSLIVCVCLCVYLCPVLTAEPNLKRLACF